MTRRGDPAETDRKAQVALIRGLLPVVLPIVIAVAGLTVGTAFLLAGRLLAADIAYAAGVLPVLAVLVFEIVTSLRRGEVGLDLVAAVAMAAALLVGETLAAAVVALMYAGGQALERYAERRASREMTALLERVPRTALRRRDGDLETVALADIEPGDRLVIRQGDVLPVDGTVDGAPALLEEAALTGESVPVRHGIGSEVMSGVTNVGDAFDLVAARTAEESTYAGIVRLVEAATRGKAPMARLADRFALWFMAATGILAVGAWIWSGDPVRAVAVLVVATPCPLILAVPVAIVAGLSRAARHGVLVKGGGALEMLGRVRTLVIDKTGTLTHGAAVVSEIHVAEGRQSDEVLHAAASLEQISQHVVAKALVAAARARGLSLTPPNAVAEVAGEGLEGRVGELSVRVGGRAFVEASLPENERLRKLPSAAPGVLTVAVAIDGRHAGLILMRDPLRKEVGDTLAALRRCGIERIVLATGDRRSVAEGLIGDLAIDDLSADLGPADKTGLVRREKAAAGPVMMVGDGVNDAPALVEADLGIAMGARGAAASAEAADAVLLADSLAGLVDAVSIARRSRRIALQSVYAGIGLSGLGMIAAALGYLPPVQGALLQEAIDVAVILNALRALR